MKNIATVILEELDTLIEEKSILKHPFYVAWTKGELSLESLQDYAAQYYHHVEAFPTYLSAVHMNTEDMGIRRHILDNLNDEEAGSPNHPELWLQFASGLGVEEEAVKESTSWDSTQAMIDTFKSLCRDGGTIPGLTALYAYESQIPQVSATKIEGLEKFYSVNDAETLAYFKVHEVADVEHSRVERELLGGLLTEENQNEVMNSANEALDGLWGLLDGVCERHNIEC